MIPPEKLEIEIPESVTVGTKAASQFITRVPELFVLVCIVGGFFWYLHDLAMIQRDRDAQNDLVAKTRIENCHNIQEESVEAMKELAKALTQQSVVFAELRSTVDELRRSIESLEEKVDKL
jgi:hypothetical protein